MLIDETFMLSKRLTWNVYKKYFRIELATYLSI